jgi:hypothetical protein
MLYGKIKEYLETFIECDTLNEKFDYSINNESSPDIYLKELKKFNNTYNSFFMNKGRLVFMINNYEIILREEDLKQILKLFLFYKKSNLDNCYLIAEFLLSYFNTINSKEYKRNVSNYKEIKDTFKKIILSNKEDKNILCTFKQMSFKLYNKIIDYGAHKDNFFLGDILERACINFNNDKLLKAKIIKKLLENNVYPSKVILYDENIKENFKYYKKYLLDYENYSIYSRFPDEMLYTLDKNGLLKNSIIKLIINNIVDRTNMLQEKCDDEHENFIQIISEIDYLKSFLNNALNRLTMLSCCHKKKMHECLINLLYMKRVLVSDEDRINSQMQEFKYEQVIPNGKIEEFVNAVNDNIAVLYSSSVCNFEKELEQSLNTYAKYPTSYIFSSYNIDSDSQTYLKSEDGFVDSVFMNYYDKKGKIFTNTNTNLQNILTKGYYIQLIKYLKQQFISYQQYIISFFDLKEGKRSLIDKLIKQGDFKLYNDYLILALTVIQIENSIIDLLKIKGKNITNNGFNNLNELAKEYTNDDFNFNGLMYINYILYERHGLNIRNNIAHGNYFGKNIDIQILTTICAIMFINGLLRKERSENDKN